MLTISFEDSVIVPSCCHMMNITNITKKTKLTSCFRFNFTPCYSVWWNSLWIVNYFNADITCVCGCLYCGVIYLFYISWQIYKLFIKSISDKILISFWIFNYFFYSKLSYSFMVTLIIAKLMSNSPKEPISVTTNINHFEILFFQQLL